MEIENFKNTTTDYLWNALVGLETLVVFDSFYENKVLGFAKYLGNDTWLVNNMQTGDILIVDESWIVEKSSWQFRSINKETMEF